MDELIEANVVHGVINASEIAPTQYRISSSQFDEAFLKIPAFITIKKYDTETYEKILEELKAQTKNGASQFELQQAVAKYVKIIAKRTLQKTSNNALIQFSEANVNLLKLLKQKDPILCLKQIYPAQYGSFNMSKYLSNEQRMPMMEAWSQIIVDAYETQSPSLNHESAKNIRLYPQ